MQYVFLSDVSDCANDTTDGSAEGSSFYCKCVSGYESSDDMMTCVGMWIT